MRGPQIVALLWLAFAGLSFSSSVRYIDSWQNVTYNKSSGHFEILTKVFTAPGTDSIYISLPDKKPVADKRTEGIYVFYRLTDNDAAWNISTSTKTKLDEFIENGCSAYSGIIGEISPFVFAIPNPNRTTSYKITLKPVGYPTSGPTIPYSSPLAATFGTAKTNCGQQIANNLGDIYIDIYGMTGPAGANTCTVPSSAICNNCAYPYKSTPDAEGCGCKIQSKIYQSKNELATNCNYYCNSNPINGAQAYTDWSRSNFDVNLGSIKCACSNQTGVQYKPTIACPVGSNIKTDTLKPTDTSGQKVVFDPTTNPNLAGSGSGSGAGTGQYDSSSNAHLARIDSILGNITDTTGVQGKIDSLLGKGKYDSAIGHDTSAIKAQIGELQGDTSKANMQGWFNGTQKTWRGHDCWQCDTIPDTSIVFDFHVFGTEIKDTLPIGISPVMTGLGFDFWPWLRALEWLCVVLVMFPICINIAGGTTGKDAV